MRNIATMRLLGGRPCLDLVNTVDARRDRWGPDLLEGFGDLLVWCGRVGVLTLEETAAAGRAAAEAPETARAALSRAKALREAIHAVLWARAGGRAAPAEGFALLGGEVARARAHQRLEARGGGFSWAFEGEAPLDRPAHRVAIDCAALLTEGTALSRVKECPGPGCGWLFVDGTRNGSRRWCSEETCGTAVRVSRHRARTRSGT